jgi:plastocyanin
MSPKERKFRIQASQFEYSPAVLSVNPGDRVTIIACHRRGARLIH